MLSIGFWVCSVGVWKLASAFRPLWVVVKYLACRGWLSNGNFTPNPEPCLMGISLELLS